VATAEPAQSAPSTPGRATTLLLTGVIGVAFVGFVVGTVGSGRASIPVPAPVPQARAPADVHPAVTYAEMGRLDIGPNRDWRTRLAMLSRAPEPDLFAVPTPDPAVKLATLGERATRRAYNGAPPVIPHAVDQRTTQACLACHEEGLRVGKRPASRLPHPFMINCTQCHVEQDSAALQPFTLAANQFVGAAAPLEGPRAWPGAPPLIPHSTLMRSDCLSCHGPGGPPGMETTHPWRRECRQCHAPSATLDQYAPSEKPSLLPGLVIRSP
jgi:cytochrome c-type protein NapB